MRKEIYCLSCIGFINEMSISIWFWKLWVENNACQLSWTNWLQVTCTFFIKVFWISITAAFVFKTKGFWHTRPLITSHFIAHTYLLLIKNTAWFIIVINHAKLHIPLKLTISPQLIRNSFSTLNFMIKCLYAPIPAFLNE